MAQLTREETQTNVNENIYVNANKEVTAQMINAVFQNFKDSFFNLLSDQLQNLKYDDNSTLSEVLAASSNIPPLWGSTGYFNITGSPSDPDISDHSEPGIVQSATRVGMGGPDMQVVITLNNQPSFNLAQRKFMVQIHTSDYTNGTMNASNDVVAPVLYFSGDKLYVGMREVSGGDQNIRLEIFAYTVNTGS